MFQLVILSVFALINFSVSSSSIHFYHKGIPIEYAPYMAAIGSGDMYIGCGGIISPSHIITVAHNKPYIVNNRVVVRVGSKYYMKDGEEIQSSELFYHPYYRHPNIDYDFLVIKLANSLQYSRKIRPITLPNDNDNINDREMLYVTGWADTSKTDQSLAHLLEVRLPMINTKICQNQYGRTKKITPRMICVGGNVDGRGQGLVDDGALAIHNTKLVGLASTVRKHFNFPTVFTRVSSVRSWLEQFVVNY